MAEVIPPNTRAVGTADPPGDMNNTADMLTLICEVLALAGEVTTTTPATAVAAVQALRTAKAGPGLLPRPRLYAPQHLRRWRVALALADQQVIPVVVAGDSIMWGQGSDNTITTTNASAIRLYERLGFGYTQALLALIGNPRDGRRLRRAPAALCRSLECLNRAGEFVSLGDQHCDNLFSWHTTEIVSEWSHTANSRPVLPAAGRTTRGRES